MEESKFLWALGPFRRAKKCGVTPAAIIFFALRCVLGLIFMYAGFLKAMDPVAFQSDLENYRLLPASIVGPVAYYLPYLELLVGAGLISGLFYSGILLISGGFLAVFLSALTAAWVRGLDIHCGCFGKASAGGSVVGSIVLDICLAGIWGVLLFAHLGKQKDDNLS